MWLKLPVAGDIFEMEGTKCNIGARLDVEKTTRKKVVIRSLSARLSVKPPLHPF